MSRQAGFDAKDVPNLKLKWAFAFPNALRTRSQPAIAMGAVFVGSQDGTVYAFDLETGCERWSFQASAEVRTAIVLKDAEDAATAPTAFFADILARAYAVDALTGELRWSIKVDDHPSATITGTPALAGEKLLVPVSSLEVVSAADIDYECWQFPRQGGGLGRSHRRSGLVALGPSPARRLKWASPALAPGCSRLPAHRYGPAPPWTCAATWPTSAPARTTRRPPTAIAMRSSPSTSPPGNGPGGFKPRRAMPGTFACMMAENPNCPKERAGRDVDYGASVVAG